MPPNDEGKPPSKRRVSTDKLKKLTGTLVLEGAPKRPTASTPAAKPIDAVAPPSAESKAPFDKTHVLSNDEVAGARQKLMAAQAAAAAARKPPAIDPAMMKTQQLPPAEQEKARAQLEAKLREARAVARPPSPVPEPEPAPRTEPVPNPVAKAAPIPRTEQITPEAAAKAREMVRAKMAAEFPLGPGQDTADHAR